MLNKVRSKILLERNNSQNSTEFRRAKLIWNVTFITSVFCVFYISVSLLIGFTAGAVSQGVTLFLYLILLILFRVKAFKNGFLAFLYTLISFQTVAILPFYSGGIASHSVILPWLAIVPIISSLLSPIRQSCIWFGVIALTYTVYVFIPDNLTVITYDSGYDKVFTVVVYGGLTLIIFAVTQTFRISNVKAIKDLELANLEINRNKELLELSCQQLDKSNKEIIDSIYYAKGVQRSVLPTKVNRQEILEESFCFQKPKKVLNGDFYWLERYEGSVYFAAVDCQEHGVAGAFKSITVHNILHDILYSGVTEVGNILDRLNNRLDQEYSTNEDRIRNSIHISLVKWNKELKKINLSSTKGSVVLVKDDHVNEIKFDNIPLGFLKKEKNNDSCYISKTIDVEKGTMVYLYTDGFENQIGGLNDTAYSNERLLTTFNNCSHLSMSKQNKGFAHRLNDWKQTNELTDDILILGMRV